MAAAPCHPRKKLVANGYCLDCLYRWYDKRKPSERYGMTTQEVIDLVVFQNYKCGLCGYDFGMDQPVIDHNHLTGTPRSIAHRKCNSLIAWAMDSPRLLREIADRLESPSYDAMKAAREEG